MQAESTDVHGGEGRDGSARAARPNGRSPRWSLDDIPYHEIDAGRLAAEARLFQLVAAASFVEITSEIYTRNLVAYYRGDREVIDWLEDGWQREEVQHGAALRRYVETAWPSFDWERAYTNFLAEYSQLCAMERLAESRALEMVARCVVETGTSSFYRMLSDAAPEPVLRKLALAISTDEVDHYKHFYRFFRRYAAREGTGRAAVLRTLVRRMVEVDAEDAACAFKHVHLVAYPALPYDADAYAAFRGHIRRMAGVHYRYDMAVKMLLKPLRLAGPAQRVVVPAATGLTRLFLFR
ncbi:MAG TPA: ferritin-like domain-containing protein [Stellaceae bacterium]|nr:ferritin-like domain-containing protein [Stellaceae bacterium]